MMKAGNWKAGNSPKYSISSLVAVFTLLIHVNFLFLFVHSFLTPSSLPVWWTLGTDCSTCHATPWRLSNHCSNNPHYHASIHWNGSWTLRSRRGRRRHEQSRRHTASILVQLAQQSRLPQGRLPPTRVTCHPWPRAFCLA